MRIVVVGDGLAGALAGTALAQAFPPPLATVRLIPSGPEDDSLGPFGGVEASRPTLSRMLAMVGLTDAEVVRTSRAGFSLGSAWSGWSPAHRTFFVPFGKAGAPLHGVPFHQLAARLRGVGRTIRQGDYAPAALMAQAGRFAAPSSDPASPLSGVASGLHVLASDLRAAVLAIADASGTVRNRACLRHVEFGPQGIGAIVLDDGGRVEAELYIDASGPAGLLISRLPGESFQSWSRWLPCDSVLVAEEIAESPPAPYAHVEAHGAGWLRTVPANGVVGQTLAYHAAVISDEQAAAMLPQACSPRRFEQGRRAKPWSGNCIAVGAAAAVVEPHHGLPLHLLGSAIEHLIALLPSALPADAEAREYNRLTIAELDRARDVAIAAYAVNGRVGEPFWDELRAMDLPDELAAKLRLFRSRGRLSLLDGDFLDEADWALLLDEMGVEQSRYDALADAVPLDRLEAQFARMRALMIDAVRPLPQHGAYLQQLRQGVAA